MTGYTETIRRWATDNRRVGLLSDADGIGEVGLEAGEAGRRLAVRFTLKVEQDRVSDIRYQVFGCGYSMAACAVAADLSAGAPLDSVRTIDTHRLEGVLEGLPDDRGYCAVLAVEALQAAVESTGTGRTVEAKGPDTSDHGPLVTAADPVYAALIDSPNPGGAADEDRHLFACLLAVAAREGSDTATALGLQPSDLDTLLDTFFPGLDRSRLDRSSHETATPMTQSNDDVLSLLLSHVPPDACSDDRRTAVWLAHILAARAARPGHLWVAMGLHERPQLTAAIRRHLPSLAAANHLNMRWKRYLYKQVCDMHGGTLCKAPNCGVCSDYALCFEEE